MLGYSIEKNEPNWGRGSWGWYFSENPPGNFRFVTLPLEILEKTSFHPWKFTKIVWYVQLPPWKFQGQKPRLTEIPCEFFFEHPWKFCFFFVDPRNFHIFFLQYPWKFYVFINPPPPFPPCPPALLCLVFFCGPISFSCYQHNITYKCCNPYEIIKRPAKPQSRDK